MQFETSTSRSAKDVRLAIAVSRYHGRVTGALERGAVEAYEKAGGEVNDLLIVPAPGAFELIAVCRGLADRADVEGIVALGCVISGETTHDRYIAHAVSQGIAQLTIETGLPIAFGVLTCQSMEQADARAGGAKGNKGVESMHALIEAVHTLRAIRASEGAAGEAR